MRHVSSASKPSFEQSHRRSLRQAVVAIATAVLVVSGAFSGVVFAAGTSSAAEVLVQQRDHRRDVKLLANDDITKKQKKSIDLYDLKIFDLGRKTRFLVHFPRITSSSKFDQMAFISMRRPRGTDAVAQVGLSPTPGSARYGYAYWFSRNRGCDPLSAVGAPKLDAAWVDVPQRCVPRGRVRISVQSLTGGFRSDEPAYSRDGLNVSGVQRLR